MNRRILLGILLIVLVMSLVTCDNGSTNGLGNNVTWNAVKDSTFGGDDISNVIWGNNKFVAVGGYGKIAYSTDGIIWTAETNTTFSSNDPNGIRGIVWGNNRFVAVSFDHIAYSSDGIIWTNAGNPFGNYVLINGIAWCNNKFVTFCNSNVAYSTDGENWTIIEYINSISHIAWGNSKYVCVGGSGGNGEMAYSTDGFSWIPIIDNKLSNEPIYGIACGNNKFVAVTPNRLAYSEDGITWVAVSNTTFSGNAINNITWGNNKFIIVGGRYDNNGVGYSKAAYSANGVTWIPITNTTFGNNLINDITWGNNRFVAVGTNGKMAYWDGND